MVKITKDISSDELRGAPLREESPGQSESNVNAYEQGKTELPPSGLANWGPWKRWKRYQELRQYERERPRDWLERNVTENENGRLPDDENVQMPAIWITELYTPSTINGLLKGIRELGWEFSETRNTSLIKWMNDMREGREAGCSSLGLVAPPGASPFIKNRTAILPSGVTAAFPVLMSLTPSLTAFVVMFLFDEETARSVEKPLRQEFTTSIRKDPLFRSWQVIRHIMTDSPIRMVQHILPPNLRRREEVTSHLQGLEDICVKWVREQFPGVFLSLKCSELPTASLLVTEKCRPLTEASRGCTAFSGLRIDRNYDAWESSEWPGARLVLPRGWDEGGKRLTFACRRHDAFPNELGYLDPTSNWTIAQRADDRIRDLLSRWAITCLLDSYHETLAALRDRAAHDGGYRPVKDLIVLRSLSRTMLYDIGACTKEIAEFANSASQYKYSVLEMSYVGAAGREDLKLLEHLQTSQIARAQQIQREAELLASTLTTSNNLTQTISSIRTQRLVIVLTIISIGIASLAAYLTFSAAS